MTCITLVYAQSRNGIIGRDGSLPWSIPSDLRRFKLLTMGSPIIMGRKTWESLPKRPLPGRHNIVMTRNRSGLEARGATVVGSKEEALAAAGTAKDVFVMGGGEIYMLFLDMARRIHRTVIDMDVEGDTKAPVLDMTVWKLASQADYPAGDSDSAPYSVQIFIR